MDLPPGADLSPCTVMASHKFSRKTLSKYTNYSYMVPWWTVSISYPYNSSAYTATHTESAPCASSQCSSRSSHTSPPLRSGKGGQSTLSTSNTLPEHSNPKPQCNPRSTSADGAGGRHSSPDKRKTKKTEMTSGLHSRSCPDVQQSWYVGLRPDGGQIDYNNVYYNTVEHT